MASWVRPASLSCCAAWILAGRRHGRRVVPLRGPTGPSRLKLLADVGGGLEYPGGVSRERADLGSRVRLQGDYHLGGLELSSAR